MMITLYGSALCPDCRECKENFDQLGIEYTLVDICASMRNLKSFLDLRDRLPLFLHSKEIGDIGIPALMLEDGTVTLDWEGYLATLGLSVLYRETGAQACSLDHKNC